VTEFKDHFSGHAEAYAAFRPGYPRELFEFLATLPAGRQTVWDAATGNGQAAVELAAWFPRVIATDASAQQIASARPHAHVEYRVGTAEQSGLPSGSVDLVTVAQALHWFDFPRFYAEAERVLRPGGALAAWTYNLVRVSPDFDAVTDGLAHDIVGTYWLPERRWVDEGYRTIPFPLAEIAAPSFEHRERWDLARLLRYYETWSACRRFKKATGQDAVAAMTPLLKKAWGDREAPRDIHWPVSLRAGHFG
jgi:SAM-dependent methyltransferase